MKKYFVVDIYEDDGCRFNFDDCSIIEADNQEIATNNYLEKAKSRIPGAFLLVAEYDEENRTVSIPIDFFYEKLKATDL